MRISLTIPEEFTVTNHGYGVASQGIVKSLQSLGHTVPYKDPTAPVEIAVGQPYHWNWSSRDSYKIGLVAWESTDIPSNWLPGLRSANEIWTPSPAIAKVIEGAGFKVSQVYQHGVDFSVWTPKHRARPSGPIRLLHIGEPAPRKGGQMTYNAFRELFGGDRDTARLTIKSHGYSTVRGKNNAHPEKELSNVIRIAEELPEWELVELVRRHDILVYPSYGEGFGLIPLQAMATGMPVICSDGWPPYRNLLIPELIVNTHVGPSPFPNPHIGNMWHPDYTDLVSAMEYAVKNFESVADRAMELVPLIQNCYDWDTLTKEAFAHIVDMFDS